ncbi:hypothetical protein BG015_002222 [Linnemannia schmuckeri]|uniref:Uncharacterized protein n=1 Tax=Linnemannia schmuckeri TaxID=64567 RepID=A0A9P5S6Q8_9FUNG|nr:hypothetical protein BG015_002222 [Linnemannia schmuckeri]
MRIDIVSKPKSPLDQSRIRSFIAAYLDRKDLVVCLRVSRDWFKDFVGPVWHTIDMNTDKKFVDLSCDVLNQYGRFIRKVINITTYDNVKTLQHPKLDSVVSMSIANHINPFHRSLELDFIRRCNATLTELDFRGQAPPSRSPRKVHERDENYLDAGILSSCLTPSTGSYHVGSRLVSLSLTGICFSHEGFTTLLRHSPVLRKLALSNVFVDHFHPGFDQFRDSSVTSLRGSLAEICAPAVFGWTPSLLHQFSQLQEWHLTTVDRCSGWGSDTDFSRELATCCPHLKTLRFDQVTNTDKLSDLLLDSFREPESLTFSAKNLSHSMILSLISHLNTLTTVIITDQCTDATAMRWLYLIPKSCLHLEVLSMRDLILDIAIVKEHKWGCQDLQELHVRFRGLEDAQLINRCIKDICSERKRPYRARTGDSISSQVSSYLVEFYYLTTVSLGTTVYSLPLHYEGRPNEY